MPSWLQVSAAFLAGISLTACAAAPDRGPKFAAIQHQAHGVVGRDHPAFRKDLDDCGSSVYARGIVMNGQRVSERAAADKIYMDYMIGVIARPGAAPMAAAEAARDPVLVTGSTKAPAALGSEPAWVREYLALDRATRECVRAKGWVEAA